MLQSPRRESYQRFPSVSTRLSNHTQSSIFACTQTKAALCIIIAWLILTFITYQKIYNVDVSRSSRKKGAIPQHHSDALNLYNHLQSKIKEEEEKLANLGIDVNNLQNANTPKPTTSTTTTTTPKPTTSTTTKKPTAKPTEKAKTGDKYFGMLCV